MIIIGVDFHPEFQQIAFVDTDTGELQERRLRSSERSRELLSRTGEPERPKCVSEWKLVVTVAGSSG